MMSEDSKITNIVIAVIPNEDNELLLLRRSKGSIDGVVWSFPSGKVEADESEEGAVIREVGEETGLQVAVVERLGEKMISSSERLIYWLCQKVGGDLKTESSGATFDLAYRPIETIQELIRPRTLNSLIANRFCPA